MLETIILEKFNVADLADSFFESLIADYQGFEDWYARKAKAGETAFVQRDDQNRIQAFLYLKVEDEDIRDVNPILPAKQRVKIGTFKVNGHNTRIGERFLKKAFDYAHAAGAEEIYVTIFDREKQRPLISKLQSFGFTQWGTKGEELVFVKDLRTFIGDPEKDYPLVKLTDRKKYLLGIKPMYHSVLFPDSALFGERYNTQADVSCSNSIHKVYICFMSRTKELKKGDLLVIYRTTDIPDMAWYRGVATSICVVEDVKKRSDFASENDLLNYVKDYSVFTENELRKWFKSPNMIVLKMTYNIALTKRLNRKFLVEEAGVPNGIYWGFDSLTDDQFNNILQKGEADESFIIH